MFDFSWSEILLIGIVALVVIPPKDLPKALRAAGQVARRARSLAREFHNSVDDMIREAELDDVRRSIRNATDFDLHKTIEHSVDPDGGLAAAMTEPPTSPPPDTPLDEPPSPPPAP